MLPRVSGRSGASAPTAVDRSPSCLAQDRAVLAIEAVLVLSHTSWSVAASSGPTITIEDAVMIHERGVGLSAPDATSSRMAASE